MKTKPPIFLQPYSLAISGEKGVCLGMDYRGILVYLQQITISSVPNLHTEPHDLKGKLPSSQDAGRPSMRCISNLKHSTAIANPLRLNGEMEL